jgi:AcrR family transcriptional regulator
MTRAAAGGPVATATHRAPGRPRSVEADRAIVEAIVDLLVEDGYREVTVEAVAARAGVAKTTIYRRWPSKVDMVIEAITACKKYCPVADCSTERVACTLVSMLSAFSCSRIARILSGLTVEMVHNEELAAAVREVLLAPSREAVVSVLRRGVETGEIRPGVDLQLVSDLLVGPLFFRMLFRGEPIDSHLAAETVELVLHGISAQPDPGEAGGAAGDEPSFGGNVPPADKILPNFGSFPDPAPDSSEVRGR